MANLFALLLAPACVLSAGLQMAIVRTNLDSPVPTEWRFAFIMALVMLILALAVSLIAPGSADKGSAASTLPKGSDEEDPEQ